jgi:hypothetical protein
LFDVQFQIRGGILNSLPLSFTRSKFTPTFFSASGNLIPSLSTRPRASSCQIAGAGGRPEQAFAEARAFFIGPIHKAHRDGRLAVVLRIDAPENFHAREHVEAAIQPAAVRHGIHVAADEQTRSDSPRNVNQSCPLHRCEFRPAVLRGFCGANSRAATHVGVNATRWAPFSSPVSARSSFSSATVRLGFSGKFIGQLLDFSFDVKLL